MTPALRGWKGRRAGVNDDHDQALAGAERSPVGGRLGLRDSSKPDDSKDPRWHREWYQRISDLIGNYHLDLLYTDGGVPFGDVGLRMIADLYNTDLSNRSRAARGPLSCRGAELLCPRVWKPSIHPQVVYTCKQKSPDADQCGHIRACG